MFPFLLYYLSNTLLYSLPFSHMASCLIQLSLCLLFIGQFTILRSYSSIHIGLHNFLMCWVLVFYQRVPVLFVGFGHVLGLHYIPSRNNVRIITNFLRSGDTWWLSTHEWLWWPRLQNGKRHWTRCLRQVPLPRKFWPVITSSILFLTK
jgi:hypothetical protein